MTLFGRREGLCKGVGAFVLSGLARFWRGSMVGAEGSRSLMGLS